MTYKIGTRVKHSVTGVTGRVTEIDEQDPNRMTMGVAVDVAGIGYDGRGRQKSWPAGEVVFDYPRRWIPILDAHEPCESDFKESLDKLLSEVRDREAV